MDRWEYSWAVIEIENGLVGDSNSPRRETINERGWRGWELVSVIDNGEQGEARKYLGFFKRRAKEI